VNRFVSGLLFGGSAYAIAWASGAPPWLALVISAYFACQIWFLEVVVAGIERFVHWLMTH
jgi:hypothetical protein